MKMQPENKNNYRFKLNRNFYPKSAIKEAILAFSKICDIEIEDNEFTIKINHIDKDKCHKIKLEFCNYCLSNIDCST
jgi:hypothetical protein